MAETLLLNPAKRRKSRRRNPTPSPAQRRARAAFAAMARARSGSARRANPKRRRRNPVGRAPVVSYEMNPRRRRTRRRNPALRAYRSASRRRRNPIGLPGLNLNSIIGTVKEAAVQGVGAVVMDMGYGYVSRYLPASLQAGPGQVTAGSAVKLLLTVAAGSLLSRATKGLSRKAAMGAATVQIADMARTFMPSVAMAGVGWSTPGRVVNRSARVGPNRVLSGVGQYTSPGGPTPLLNGVGQYTAPGSRSPLLSGAGSARLREGYAR